MKKKDQRIAFQGAAGAYSDIACRTVFPDFETIPCFSFEDAFSAVRDGKAIYAMIPVENSVAGRVADVHALMRREPLSIVGEFFLPITHHLLALPGVKLSEITEVQSHVQALSQCANWLRKQGLRPVTREDTAGSAEALTQTKSRHVGVIASELAGVLYGLKSLAGNIADRRDNTTRFLILANKPSLPKVGTSCVTSLIFKTRSVPAALYKALGGFATNGVNITRIESYVHEGRFTAAQFYLDAEGHPAEPAMKNALDELSFFAESILMLGTYPAHEYRLKR